MLLRELEEARGTVVRMSHDDDSMDVSSSSGVITSHLVTFRYLLPVITESLILIILPLSSTFIGTCWFNILHTAITSSFFHSEVNINFRLKINFLENLFLHLFHHSLLH